MKLWKSKRFWVINKVLWLLAARHRCLSADLLLNTLNGLYPLIMAKRSLPLIHGYLKVNKSTRTEMVAAVHVRDKVKCLIQIFNLHIAAEAVHKTIMHHIKSRYLIVCKEKKKKLHGLRSYAFSRNKNWRKPSIRTDGAHWPCGLNFRCSDIIYWLRSQEIMESRKDETPFCWHAALLMILRGKAHNGCCQQHLLYSWQDYYLLVLHLIKRKTLQLDGFPPLKT